MTAFARELAVAEAAAAQAGALLRRHYAAPTPAHELKGDGSPVSRADVEADAAIAGVLAAEFPDDARLTEETPDAGARLGRSRVWIVDPLDGTRDFLARTGDFCVNVALAIDGRPTVAAVHHVVADETYVAVVGQGAWRVVGGRRERLAVASTARLADLRVAVSRTNLPPRLEARLGDAGLAARLVRRGAAVKYLLLARGEVDAILTVTTGEKEWDTCAPELLVSEAGGRVTDGDGRPFAYNQASIDRPRGIVASNGPCHADLVALIRPELP